MNNSNSIFAKISNLFVIPTVKDTSPGANPYYDSKSFYIIGRDTERARSTENILRRIVAETGQNTKIYIQN